MASSKNKKVLNATEVIIDNIRYRSILERRCHELLLAAGITPRYEEYTCTLTETFKPKSLEVYLLWKPRLRPKVFSKYPNSFQSITYTPDFDFEYKDYWIIIDTKGHSNDTYPLKKKMFMRYLDDYSKESGKKIIFFEPHSIKQIKESINIILSL